MRVLGIHDGHNASACLYEDGQMVAAIQEERLRRIKNWSGMPLGAVDFVLHAAGLQPEQVDWVALNGYHSGTPQSRDQLMDEYRRVNDLGMVFKRKFRRATRAVSKSIGLFEPIRQRLQSERIRSLLALGIPAERAMYVEHHTAHASAAYYGWANFSDDVLVLTADGSGDGICATVSIGRRGKLERLHQIPMAHSIGKTRLLGLRAYLGRRFLRRSGKCRASC